MTDRKTKLSRRLHRKQRDIVRLQRREGRGSFGQEDFWFEQRKREIEDEGEPAVAIDRYTGRWLVERGYATPQDPDDLYGGWNINISSEEDRDEFNRRIQEELPEEAYMGIPDEITSAYLELHPDLAS